MRYFFFFRHVAAICLLAAGAGWLPLLQAQTLGVYRELWTGLDPSQGNTLAILTNTTVNPNWPNNPNPAYTTIFTNFEAEAGSGFDWFGQRMRTFLTPPADGNYTFWIASDDNSALFLSIDEEPANKRLVASVATWTGSREWTKEANQKSALIPLLAGKRYYAEAIMENGNGGYNLAVRWQLPNGVIEEPIPAARMQLDQMPAISSQPANLTVPEATMAAFTIAVSNIVPPNFQWQRGATNIAGATNATFTLSDASLSDSGAAFRCVISNSVGVVRSAYATLTVVADTTPPTLLAANNAGLTNVVVSFSERVEAASATNLNNYYLNGNVTISAAILTDPRTVLLVTSPLSLGSNYALTVNQVRDLASHPNTIAPNSQFTFTATDFAPVNIGGAIPPGSLIVLTNGDDVGGGGLGFDGAADQFEYCYQLRSGDFDLKVRVQGLTPTDPWAKAGLMAREALDPGSRFAAMVATPTLAGCFFEARASAGATPSVSGAFPVNYPLTWLRLQRTGSQFNGYGSVDGQNWVPLGSVGLPIGGVYIGYAVTSHNPSVAAVAQFRDFGPVVGGTVGSLTLPFEPLGPCSRRTGLVISEIMYTPAPRLDGRNIEYLELYNSNPFFEDISGHTISGDINFTFPTNTILAGGAFLVVAAVPADIQSVYNINNLTGPYTGSFKKKGSLTLSDKQGTILLAIPYQNASPWPVAADGTGHSLVLAHPSYGEADERAWGISEMVGGSPGGPEAYRPSPLRNVVINEIFAHSENPSVHPYIELYNHSNQTNDLSGCILTDDPAVNRFLIPAGTHIPPRGFVAFDENQLGFGPGAGGNTLFLKNPDASHVIDAVGFDSQADGVAYGRWPDGAAEFFPLAARTPAAPNSGILIRDIVINELMYAPISGNDDDQYIEIYNKGANAMDLGGWTFASGITFVFPTNTVVAPGGYLVVARNAANLFSHYPNLNVGNTVGSFSGKLPHKGGRIALAMPQPLTGTNSHGALTTNTIHVIEDEVTFSAGGRWGQWAHGGGSSLELLNPNTNHRLAYNWGDSDETSKASWTNLEFTGVLDNGGNYNNGPIDLVQIGLLDVGECLVDNVELRPGASGANYITNPDFETGLTGWTAQGDHIRSSLETSLGGYLSSHSLHLRSSDGVWTLFNSVQGTLNNTSLGAGTTATLRMKARWMHGWPEILMRVRGNWIELSGAMPVPANLGTPGLKNSRYVTNTGPAIYEVKHSPPLPSASQPVVVTARFHDQNGFQPALLYRLDTAVNPTPTYIHVPMVDDGTGGDAVRGDGLYSATIPAQAAGTVAAFLVQAQDSFGASSLFPADLKDNSGWPRECVVMFGDTIPTGSFGHYHVFMTQNWINRWASLGGVSNEGHDGTFVDGGGRVIYNWVGRYAGSPYHQYLGSPVTTLGGQHWNMPVDDQMLGTTSFNKQHVPGNGTLDDTTLQREQTSFWMARQLGLAWNYRRFYVLYVNGNRHGPLMEDSQTPGGDFIKQHWPNDNNGFLYKNNVWFEGDTALQPNGYMNFAGMAACTLNEYPTTINGAPNQHKLARYRWIYWMRQFADSASNYTNVYNLVDAANTPVNTPAYYSNMEAEVDTEEWMRLAAIEHATGDWDSFLRGASWNMYCYKPLQGKWTVLKWDWNITLGVGGYSWGPDGNNLFTVTGDNVMSAFQTYPPYLRAYLRAFKEIAGGPMNNTYVDPELDAKYAAFVANGLTTASYGVSVANPGAPGGLKSWIATMHNSLLTALTNQGVANVPFAVSGPNNLSVGNNLMTFSGTAPVEVKNIIVNGELYPITWTSVTGWQLRLALAGPTNALVFQGLNLSGSPLASLAATIMVTYTNPIVSPQGGIVINEIMYNPVVTNAQFVELYNTAPAFTFDLSNWRLSALNYTFPPGSLLAPGGFLVLAQDRAAFARAYGSATPVFDVFHGVLEPDGGTLTLARPDAPGPDQLVDQVTYSSNAPWPSGADAGGFSLQLIDPAQDRQRVANWFGGVKESNNWHLITVSGVASGTNFLIYLNAAGDAYLDEVALVPVSGPFAGVNVIQNGDFESPLSGPWIVPNNMTNTAITSAFAHSGNSSLHVVAASGGTGLATTLRQGLPAAVSNVNCTLSFWYRPGAAGTNLYLRTFPGSTLVSAVSLQAATNGAGHYTPGAPNSARASLPPFPPVWLNEIQPDNITGPTDRFGHHSPWVELYNGGAAPLDLTGCYLGTNYADLALWAFPSNTMISGGQFLLVWLDGNPDESTNTELHTSFAIAAVSGSLALSKTNGSGSAIIDYLNYNVPIAGTSYGDYPDGNVSGRGIFRVVTPGATNSSSGPPLSVFINEWMANNSQTIINPADAKYDDWFELYNAGVSAADLSGAYLSHTATNQFEFRIPTGYSIPPGGHLLVWADKLTSANDPNSSDLHVNFRLSKSGTLIGAYDADGATLDQVTFGAQTNDVSMGRCPDGSQNIIFLSTPTPRASNPCFHNLPPVVTPISDQYVFAGQSVAFYATATDPESLPEMLTFSLAPGFPSGAGIDANSGLFSWTPLPEQAPATNILAVRVTDNGAPPLSAAQEFHVFVYPPPPPPTLVLSNGKLSLTFATFPGKTYRVEFKNDLAEAVWSPFSGNMVASGTSATVNDQLGSNPQRFYRFVLAN